MCWFNKHVNVVEEYKHWGPLECSLPNSRIGFFYSCVTEKLHVNDPCPSSTRTYFDGHDEIGDVYSNANSYQSHMMDISKELMTFSIGGPRFFENNTLLENSLDCAEANLANCTQHADTFRDCKYVLGSPMVRMHYEYPTNPSLKGGVMNEPAMWWEVDNRQEDIFENTNDYIYVSTRLTHLTKCGGYDCGELLSYLPMYDVLASTFSIHTHKKLNLTPRSVHANFLRECRNHFFKIGQIPWR